MTKNRPEVGLESAGRFIHHLQWQHPFRSKQGAVGFCRIRGYLSTLRKQGLHVLDALEATFRGQPTLPSFKVS